MGVKLDEKAFTYQACLFVLQAKGKKQQKMEAKQIIRAVVRKAGRKKKKNQLQQPRMQKAQKSLFVLNSEQSIFELNEIVSLVSYDENEQ